MSFADVEKVKYALKEIHQKGFALLGRRDGLKAVDVAALRKSDFYTFPVANLNGDSPSDLIEQLKKIYSKPFTKAVEFWEKKVPDNLKARYNADKHLTAVIYTGNGNARDTAAKLLNQIDGDN